jgi:hypothetical protein
MDENRLDVTVGYIKPDLVHPQVDKRWTNNALM